MVLAPAIPNKTKGKTRSHLKSRSQTFTKVYKEHATLDDKINVPHKFY